ncbi:MAG: Methionine--tRNA ligase [candidate division WS6 bacterium OLB20]|uniref:Methionine--tRNA ligase n=1 Tax=candidate division WS6 bacterium OLB20 TaxID=1617426 RepID=A0A136LZ24_9BACT|nr:MAG: Methionine--tRNA ligase [candidate division WS6 bacterium OLB20]
MHKHILIAVAWPYVNGDIHVGHLSGYLLPADMMARYHRLRGNDVLMVSGSDTHGTPITVEADKRGVSPSEIVDQYHKNDIALFKQLGLSYNLYTTTMTETHKRVTQELFLDLLSNGYIVKGMMKQYYAQQDDQFLPDRYVEGTCPYCKTEGQRSDQCENCGRWIEDGELVDPHSKLTGSPVELRDTEHYFLDFEQLTPQLSKYIAAHEDIWRHWVHSESQGWLNEGLRKRAITRDMDWAIELPVEEIQKLDPDKQLASYEGKKLYVWFEAVIGYLSAPQEWSATTEEHDGIIFSRTQGQSTDWQQWWHNPDAMHYYFMGQDNLVFHTLMWPAQLMGSGRGYHLPDQVLVNKFMNYEGKKFSKSRGWTIDSKAMAEKYGVDPLRFYIASNLPEHKEANFTWEGFADTINNELVANLGNLANRSLTFFATRFESITRDGFTCDDDVMAALHTAFDSVASAFEHGNFVRGIELIMQLSRTGNQYFEQAAVWRVIKEDKDEAARIMLNLLNLLANISVLIAPVMPDASERLRRMLGLDALAPEVDTDYWGVTIHNSFSIGAPVEILFAKLDRDTVLKERV